VWLLVLPECNVRQMCTEIFTVLRLRKLDLLGWLMCLKIGFSGARDLHYPPVLTRSKQCQKGYK
jgi:hypothetical protein